MAVDEQVSAETATRHVRAHQAARRLYQLRIALAVDDRSARSRALTGRMRQAERRAHRALMRAGFTDPAIAAEVLRQVQVLTMTTALARLDYRTADAAQAAITNLIASPTSSRLDSHTVPVTQINGHATHNQSRASAGANDRDVQLIAAATRIVAGARHGGGRLSQAALAARLRRDGYTIANNRLRWLSAASGLESRRTEPDRGPFGG